MDTAHFEKLNRIRLVPVLLKARTEIPPLVTEVSLSFMASPCTPVHVALSTTRADAIAVLTVDKCDRLVERRPARPNVTHRDVLVPDRHATKEDEPVRG